MGFQLVGLMAGML